MSEEQVCKEIIEQVGYQEFYRYFQEKTTLIEQQRKEIERLNNIINELEKCIRDKYYEAIDYQTKLRQSDLMQGDYPVSYYLKEQNEQLCNYFLSRLKDLQEIKGERINENRHNN